MSKRSETLRELCMTLKGLEPTSIEIKEYAKGLIDRGMAYKKVNATHSLSFFPPKIHKRKRPMGTNSRFKGTITLRLIR